MRMLALPAALALGAAFYMLLPRAEDWIHAALRALFSKVRLLFTTKRGRTDDRSAAAVYFLAVAAAATLLCAIHPAVCALLAAPLFTAFHLLPGCVSVKADLDAGRFSKDIPAYEQQVLLACRPLGDAFAQHAAAPLMLCALGMPLGVGCALGWLYAALTAAEEHLPACSRFLVQIRRAGSSVTVILLHLCAGLVGRNPLRIGGRGASQKLMHILCLEGEIDHAPIAGDITQAIFLCCLCTGLLCGVLTLTGALII